MNRTLSNRLKQAEKAAASRQPQRKITGMGELYRRMHEEPETLSPQFQQLLKEMALKEMTTAELLELRGYYTEKGIDLSSVPTEILLKARDSKQPDKVLADWIGSQP